MWLAILAIRQLLHIFRRQILEELRQCHKATLVVFIDSEQKVGIRHDVPPGSSTTSLVRLFPVSGTNQPPLVVYSAFQAALCLFKPFESPFRTLTPNVLNFTIFTYTMSIRRQSIVAVVAALFLTGAIIGTITYVQLQQKSTTGTQSPGAGTLSVAVTDPPNTSSGVTAAYMSYSNIQVHISNASNRSGWYTVATLGTLQLFNLINVSQTIGTTNIPAGAYNLVKFNVTAATVTYNGKNYTAFVPSGEFLVTIRGDVSVNHMSPSGILLNLTPTITNVGSNSLPEFIIAPAVHVFVFPHGQVSSDDTHVGHQTPVSNMTWFKGEDHRNSETRANVTIATASLSTDTLSVTVNNTGNSTANLMTIFVGPALASSSNSGDHTLTQSVFVIFSNGTLMPMVHSSGEDGESSDSNSPIQTGYALVANSSYTFNFNGTISFAPSPCNSDHCGSIPLQSQDIVVGQQYSIFIIGDGVTTSIVATATA